MRSKEISVSFLQLNVPFHCSMRCCYKLNLALTLLLRERERERERERGAKMTVRVCLFRDEIKWMENFGEKMRRKMGRKTFLSMFGWMEMKENRWWGSSIFSPCPPKWKEN